MKILITSNTGKAHKFLWNKIINTGHEVYVFAQTHRHSENMAPLPGLSQRIFRAIKTNPAKLVSRYRAKRIAQFFETDYQFQLQKHFVFDSNLIREFKNSDRYFEYIDINDREAELNLKQINPDLIIVQGGKILKDHFFESVPFGTLHLHGGIVPWYRGGKTWFANIVNDDLYHIGPTIQEIDSGIDTGNIIHQHVLKIEQNETPSSLYAKTCVVGVEILLNCLTQIQQTKHKLRAERMYVTGFNYSNKILKKYESEIVYRRFEEVVQNHRKGDFAFRPSNLIQQAALMSAHPFVKY